MSKARASQPWSAQEDQQLIDAHNQGASIEQLALVHERTIGAIKSRLHSLGLIEYKVNGKVPGRPGYMQLDDVCQEISAIKEELDAISTVVLDIHRMMANLRHG